MIKAHIKNVHCNITDDLWAIAKTLFMVTRTEFYTLTGFSWIYFVIFEYFYLSNRLIWVLCPTLIISFALNISMKFQQIKKRLEKTNPIQMNQSFWNEIYNHYLIVYNLTMKASSFLSLMISIIVFIDFYLLVERLYRQFS